MKQTLLFALILAVALGFASCSKKDAYEPPTTGNSGGTPTQSGTPTQKGTPQGAAVSKTIGPEGGVLYFPDKRISISIPAGAVNTATTFSIQPIENHAPNGLGLAYRLLPEGTHFNKPVTVNFAYDDSLIYGTAKECLFIAYQNEKNVWMASAVQVKENEKMVSVQTTHFSDWAIFATFRLAVAKRTLELNESTTLSVKEVDVLLSPLNDHSVAYEVTSKKVTNWKLDGEGKLTPSGPLATYTAPDHVPSPNPVVVSAEINDIPTNNGKRGKVIVLAPIKITGEYVEMTFGGNEYLFAQCHTQTNGNYMMITAADGGAGVHMNIRGFKPGTYKVSHTENGTTLSVITGTKVYQNSYITCEPPAFILLDASITVTKVGDTGEYIEGTFGGTVATEVGDCGHDKKAVSGTFKVKRRF